MVYVPRRSNYFSVFCPQSFILIPKSTTRKKLNEMLSLSNPILIKIHIKPQAFTEIERKCIMARQFEKCPNNYVPLYLSIKAHNLIF